MAYANFKPTIWAKAIQREIEEKAVLAKFCNTQFEGEAKQGNKVRILSAAAPTIGDYDQTQGIGDPETQEGTFVDLLIDEAKFFNFMVDDIDRAQSNPALMAELTASAGYGLTAAREWSIAKKIAEHTNASTSTGITTPAAAKKAVDAALLALYSNGVTIETPKEITIAPWFYQLFRDYLVEIKTQNDDLIRRGVVGMYDGATVVMTNFIHNDGTDDNMSVRTKRAIGLATQVNETEAYRPDKFFSDAIRGLLVFGDKVIHPNELYTIKAHNK